MPASSARRRESSSTTDGESDNDAARSLDEVSDHAAKAQSTTPRKSKLGVIGGSKKPSSTTTQKGNMPERDQRTSSEVDERSENLNRREMTVVSPRAKTASPLPKSSQERADEEREKLKRQLEAKSQAPVKKKRRF
jgi:hypothetical protein